ASDTWDPLDHSEPPPIGAYVSVSFPRPDWELYPNDYTTDFRAEIGAGQAWPFVVSTNIPNSETQITFAGMETIPPDLEVFLVDEKLNITQDLRKQAEYTFASGVFGAKKQLKLLVGSSQFLTDETSGIASVPDKFVLFQNFPNPFNPATTIRYGLPSAQEVTIRVYDILGREVTTLVDHEMKEAGFHALTWGGSNSNGRPVASGLYVYRIEAGKFSQTRKMLLVK
ncbi:MAG: T9SS type A sorting domain-containing protein, partial [bacterium]